MKQAWSVGVPRQLLVRKNTCCCSACLARDFENCNIKVLYFEVYFLLYLVLYFVLYFCLYLVLYLVLCISLRYTLQAYTGAPVLANFSPAIRSTKDLRSSAVASAVNDSDIEDSENTPMTEALDIINPVLERHYAVLSDAPQGYYIVKCLKVNTDSMFKGCYYRQVSDVNDQDNLVFKETRQKDSFHFATIITEITASQVTGAGDKVLRVNKTDLNDVIDTVAGIDDE